MSNRTRPTRLTLADVRALEVCVDAYASAKDSYEYSDPIGKRARRAIAKLREEPRERTRDKEVACGVQRGPGYGIKCALRKAHTGLHESFDGKIVWTKTGEPYFVI